MVTRGKTWAEKSEVAKIIREIQRWNSRIRIRANYDRWSCSTIKPTRVTDRVRASAANYRKLTPRFFTLSIVSFHKRFFPTSVLDSCNLISDEEITARPSIFYCSRLLLTWYWIPSQLHISKRAKSDSVLKYRIAIFF